MDTSVFINEALDIGIKNHLNKENADDFMTVIIEILISIYGELDIVNPYKTKNESAIGGFDYNIIKYGYSKENLSIFKQNVMNFYSTKDEKPNKYFNPIEKALIDMFIMKYKAVGKGKIDVDSFKKKLSFENSPLNETYSTDKREIEKYFNFKIKELDYNLTYTKINNNILDDKAYTSLGYSVDNVKEMNEQQITQINDKLFDHYNIDKTKEDKYERLDQALEYYNEFEKEKVEEKPKSENGYTEVLLILGFVLGSLIVVATIVGVLS